MSDKTTPGIGFANPAQFGASKMNPHIDYARALDEMTESRNRWRSGWLWTTVFFTIICVALACIAR